MNTTDTVFNIAIVGSGPSALYAADYLLEQRNFRFSIDIIERLPTPWGLIRSGVAPDHPEKKLVVDRLFSYVLARSEIRFLGNVDVGKDINHADLTARYDAVIYASGANSDTKMNIEGENLPGCWAAREFVAWYNGHPDYSHLTFDLSSPRAVIIGNGNVALDIARILTLPITDLEKTDIADHALKALRQSQVKEVVIVGRRGYLQSAFNNPELEEFGHIANLNVVVEDEHFPTTSDTSTLNASWETRRKVATLNQLQQRSLGASDKRVVFRYLTSPKSLLGNNKVEQIELLANALQTDSTGQQQAIATEKVTTLETRLVLRAIGYRGKAMPHLPFDTHRGVINNIQGRVEDEKQIVTGTYVTGWIKRGATGVIGTNKKCAHETVDCLLEDITQGRLIRPKFDAASFPDELVKRHIQVVNKSHWNTINLTELQEGRHQHRPRIKRCTYDALMTASV